MEPSARRPIARDASHAQRDERSVPKAPAAVPQASLPDEIATLDRARAALVASDPGLALRVLDEYDQVLHGARLAAEATLLRIDALSRSGRAAAASELAARFIDANPGSTLADRARAFVHAGLSSPGLPVVDSGGVR